MELHLLGTTGYHPNNRRHTACFMLPELGVVFDAGTGMFRVRDELTTDTLDIFLSHAHLDHVVGLTYLLDVLWQKPMRHVRVWGEQEKLDAVRNHLFSPNIFPVTPPFEMRALPESVELSDGARITNFPLIHPGGAVGYRLDVGDQSLAYVTDTTAKLDAEYIDKIRGVDVLLHECYFPDGWEEQAELTGHSCLTPVAQVAAAADVGLLLLVHINPLAEAPELPGLDEARNIFPAIEIGEDGTKVTF